MSKNKDLQNYAMFTTIAQMALESMPKIPKMQNEPFYKNIKRKKKRKKL